jgi:hypothetical protein
MPTPNKYYKPRRIEIYNVQGVVKKTEKSVVLELDTGSTILDLHFGDPTQLMNFFVLMIEEMAKVFPDFEASKLWLDDSFK